MATTTAEFPWTESDIVQIVHTSDHASANLVMRFKNGFYTIKSNPDPDSPRWKVHVPLVDGTKEVWRCNIKDCESCARTAGNDFTDLNINAAAAHGLVNVPVKDPFAGKILGILTAQGLQKVEDVNSDLLVAKQETPDANSDPQHFKRTFTPFFKSTGTKGPAGDINTLRELYKAQPAFGEVSQTAIS
jgi:hypothetical protein